MKTYYTAKALTPLEKNTDKLIGKLGEEDSINLYNKIEGAEQEGKIQ